MRVKVPETLKAALEPDALAALDEALGPPREVRLPNRYEIEIEAAGEGTFTLMLDAGVPSARKGFARDEPFLSCALPKGGWPFVRRLLQAAVDGFPATPSLRERQERLKAIRATELKAAVQGIAKLQDLAIEVDVGGVGHFKFGRGALDEVTRDLKVSIPAAAIDRALAGAGVAALSGAKVSGDRGLTTEIFAALGPLVTLMKR